MNSKLGTIQVFCQQGGFKYSVSKEVGGWGQKMVIFADLQYYLCWHRWVGGPKKAKKCWRNKYLNGPNRPKQSQISDSQIKKAPRSTLLEIEKQFYGLAVDLLSR